MCIAGKTRRDRRCVLKSLHSSPQMNTLQENRLAAVQKAEAAMQTEVVDRLQRILSLDDYEMVLSSFSEPKPVVFRVNTIRSTTEQVLSDVEGSGLVANPIPWCPLGFKVETGSVRDLQALDSNKDGSMYIQAASSMVAANAVQVNPGMSVLDMCAAPGGKTTQLAAAMNNMGILIANDRSRKRLYRLREIVQWQHATNVEVLCGSGEQLGKSHADCFDRVLVDVPCSGEGRFRLDRPARLANWSLQTVRKLSKLQEQLLVAALRCVKVGGLVVYSTCTFAPEENEFVLERALSRRTIDAKVVPLPKSLIPSSARTPIKEWGGKSMTHNLESAVRIIPDGTTTGFFVAVLERQS